MPDKPSELKPCPFCGADALVEKHPEPGTHEIGCEGCTCNVMVYTDIGDMAGLVDHWNRRTPDRAALVEVARRALNTPGFGMHNHTSLAIAEQQQDAAAERIVTEYLAEQAGKDSE